MTTRTLILAAVVLVVLLLGGAAAFWFLSFGQPTYVPGKLASAARAGTILQEAPAAFAYGPRRPDGSEPFAIEVEPGIVLAGFARGSGAPTLVVHGGPGFPSDVPWAGLAPFENRHRFFYWHQRGSGRSTRPIDRFATSNFPKNVEALDRQLGLGQQVADIERLRRALAVDKIDLVGHSFGGFIACLYAIEFPQRVGKLLLVAPAPMIVFPPADGGLYEEVRHLLPNDERTSYEAWTKKFFDYGKLFTRSEQELAELNAGIMPFYERAVLRSEVASRAAFADAQTASLAGGWMMQAIFFSMGRRHDWTQAFAQIAAPVTVLLGTNDITPVAAYDQYRVIATAQVATLENADHFLFTTREPFAAFAAPFFE